ncbi:MAG: PIN domain-containing protein [Candidatus Lokiarchaeota archaeon]|nr:PIN domain-containing protein [Candidatus Lokiarchaeota archaeon]
MTYLFDTSTIINIIQDKPDKAIKIFKGHNLLDLSYYELGNVLWKFDHRKLFNKDEIKKIRETIELIWNIFRILKLNIEDFESTLNIAFENKITFYDASFIYLAHKSNFTLVSDDIKMITIGKKYGNVINSNEIPLI